MPYKPKKPCVYPGCSELVDVGKTYCDRHEAERRKQYYINDNRPSARRRGYDETWEKLRKMYLAEHPLCEDCLENGIYTPATEVHHIKKVKDNPELRLDINNLRALCKACHNRRTARGE
ncbi:HNH endonuclease signature motif containing protein [Caldanaerobacter sp.]|uniref:HNH endonuclease signature motif containing protein n=1 Tax=Caldanaerobacter sp. TaxID=2930036 RepID=UPI003C73D21A